MGIYDTITFQSDPPAAPSVAGKLFQTKSLFAAVERLTITTDDRLIWHRRAERTWGERGTNDTAVSGHGIAYHGDLLLSGKSDGICQLIARFTHSRLDWVRPAEDCPETNRELLLEQLSR